MKNIFWGILLSAGAFFVGRATVSPVDTGSHAKVKLQELLDVEYADYQRLKTLEERYKKADEILGKVMVIFLADLQLHAKPADPLPAMPKPVESPALLTQSTPSIQKNAVQALPPKPVPRVYDRMVNLHQVNDDRRVGELIKTKRVENLQPIWAKSEILSRFPPQLDGCYFGHLSLDPTKPSQEPETVEITMFHRSAGVDSVSVITLRYKGGGVSRTRGRGKPNGYRVDHTDSNALLIETADDYMYEIYYVPNLRSWAGNVYAKQPDESRKPIGKVVLSQGGNCEQ